MREHDGRTRILRRFVHAAGADGLRFVDMPGAALPQRQSTGERLISCERHVELQRACTCSETLYYRVLCIIGHSILDESIYL